jgi:hypothetical protein
VIDGVVIGDLEQPGGEPVVGIVAVEVVEGFDEGLLRQVLSLLTVPDHPVDQGEDGPSEALEQFSIRRLIPFQGLDDQLLVVGWLAAGRIGVAPGAWSPTAGWAVPSHRVAGVDPLP